MGIRDFVMKFEHIVTPIRDAIKWSPFIWTEEAEDAFRWCIELLESTHLDYFNNDPFDMFTDAAKGAIGCTITRMIELLVYSLNHWINQKWNTHVLKKICD